MWTRRELKKRAKVRFKANYWKCVVVAFILLLVSGGLSVASNSKNAKDTADSFQVEDTEDFIAELNELISQPEFSATIRLARTASLLLTVLTLLVFNPLQVGCQSFYLKNATGAGDLNDLERGFKPSWLRNVISMFLTSLFLALWFLLFLIPGIIKTYSYRLVPYILADDPNVDALDAITRSRKMMRGHKWDAFVLDLSFLGWGILTILTAGLLGYFYVFPYKDATDAELYLAIKSQNTNL